MDHAWTIQPGGVALRQQGLVRANWCHHQELGAWSIVSTLVGLCIHNFSSVVQGQVDWAGPCGSLREGNGMSMCMCACMRAAALQTCVPPRAPHANSTRAASKTLPSFLRSGRYCLMLSATLLHCSKLLILSGHCPALRMSFLGSTSRSTSGH